MLEQPYQIDAFNALRAAGGLTPPESATLYRTAVTRINQLISELSALLPEAITYPSSLAEVISRLDGITEDLTDASTLFESVITLIESNADTSALLRLQIGWEIYCRLNSEPGKQPPAIIELIADVATPQAVDSLVNSLSTSDLKAAFTILNNILIAVGTASPATPGVPVVIPEDLLDDVSDAVDAFADDIAPLLSLLQVVSTDKQNAEASVALAMSYYKDAITISLLDSLSRGEFVAPAVACIAPQSVIDALAIGQLYVRTP
ncbi:hypothetical protein [Enterobacter cloacae]|uniref:hypothetical protein n=1 Tax=Enterobacter cloacae TaxID=550 RepID=UPI000588ED9F|nr:hypothetical protein [Enterobacter cloacae]KIF96426.1 hypothetical protein SD66_08435 [Enterobacter cloacae]